MKWNNKKPSAGQDLRQWRMAAKIAAGLHWVQRSWADCMNKSFGRLSPRGRKWALLLFFFGMMIYSGLLVVSAFKQGIHFIDAPVKLSLPDVLRKTSPPPASPGQPSFLLPIKKFRHYLDSLGSTENGRLIRDSLLRKRPGLLDSIRQIEKVYCKEKGAGNGQMDQ